MRWNWACEKMKASAIGTASKAIPAPLLIPSTIRKCSSSLALLYAVIKASPQNPSLTTRDSRCQAEIVESNKKKKTHPSLRKKSSPLRKKEKKLTPEKKKKSHP